MIYQYIYISYSQTVNSLYILNSTGHRRKLIMLDFRVSTFLTVCEYMNYTKAAEALHITQPAVTQHIHYLEKLYHIKLFQHDGKKLLLSPAGKILLRTASAIKSDEQFMKEQISRLSPSGLALRFGTTMTIGEAVISEPLASYLSRHPGDSLSLIISNTDDLLKRLRTGDIHFALVEGNYDTSEFNSHIYRTEPFIPVCSTRHSLPNEPCRIRDLFNEHLLLREPGSGTRDILEKHLDMKNIRLSDFTHITEIGSMHVILELLEKNLGISFLYEAAALQGIQNGTLRRMPLKDFELDHDFTFIWNRGSVFSDIYLKVYEELRRYQ